MERTLSPLNAVRHRRCSLTSSGGSSRPSPSWRWSRSSSSSLLHLTPGRPRGDDRRRPRHDRGHRPHPRQARASTSRSWTRFGHWLWRVLHGDLGISIFTNLPVTHLIGAAARADAVARLLHAGRSPCCRRAARRRRRGARRHLDRPRGDGVLGGRVLGAGVRGRLRADLRLRDRARLAAGAGLPADREGLWAWLRNLVLPCIALGTVYIALIARMTRASMLDVLRRTTSAPRAPRAWRPARCCSATR